LLSRLLLGRFLLRFFRGNLLLRGLVFGLFRRGLLSRLLLDNFLLGLFRGCLLLRRLLLRSLLIDLFGSRGLLSRLLLGRFLFCLFCCWLLLSGPLCPRGRWWSARNWRMDLLRGGLTRLLAAVFSLPFRLV
jgi:hypothetical protein